MIIGKARLAAILALTMGVGAGVTAQVQNQASTGAEKAAIDKPVKMFVLKDIAKEPKEGEKENAALVDLAKLKDKKAAVLFFMSERCSVTWRYEKRVGELLKDLAKKDVTVYGVRCSAGDTPESIKKWAETRNFAMPILNDEKGEMTKFYGIRQTPTFVVVDKKGVLRYKGGFDDNPDENGVKNAYVKTAVASVLEGKDVAVKEARVFG